MDLELAGRTAIVTGGSRGIGKAVARELAREEMDVAIAARGTEALEDTARELAQETRRRIFPIQVDTGDDKSAKAMVKQAVELMGRVDVLVNCAARPLGQSPEPGLADITDEHFWADINVKSMGYLRCAREVVPYMKQRGWGRIINVSGLAARNVGSITGSVRNVAVVAMAKNLADQLGPYGITSRWCTRATPAPRRHPARSRRVPRRRASRRMRWRARWLLTTRWAGSSTPGRSRTSWRFWRRPSR